MRRSFAHRALWATGTAVVLLVGALAFPFPPVASAGAKVGCIGTNTDGKRVQIVYARRSNHADNYSTVAPQLKARAAEINWTFERSAQKTGGHRQVRWVTDSSCSPTVLKVTLASTVTTFDQLLAALKASSGPNLTDVSRKYLVAWDDGDATDHYCGLSETMPDSKAGPTNANETQPLGAMFATAETGCWTGPLLTHELMHSLGAVQKDAPHATALGHCTDGSDLLCYADAAGVVVSKTCPTTQQYLLDCNDDDYFNTNPPTGNYLKTHWNPAMSGWLEFTAPPSPDYLPYTGWAPFVSHAYIDITGTPPTTAQLDSWVDPLWEELETKGGFIDSLRRGTENTTNVDPTARLYRAFLGRAPDASGLMFWIGRRRAGTWSLTRMADSFATSNEFTTKYGTLTNRAFVTRIYTDVLERSADQAGVDYWTRKLDTGSKTRGGVMVGFSESSEYKRKQAENTDVAIAYIFLLGRVPTITETTTWVTRQKAGTTHVVLLTELLDSAEYARHVGA